MKTLEDLSNKIWYRTLKVIYILAILGLLVWIGIRKYNDKIEYPFNYNKTRITCIKSNDLRVDISKSAYNISGSLTFQQKQKIANDICHYTGNDMYDVPKEDAETYLSYNNVFIASHGVMEEKLNVWAFVWGMLILIIAFGIATEVLRRMLYYILFGVFAPQKLSQR